MENYITKVQFTFRKKILYFLLTIVSAVILPQLAHFLGIVTGTAAIIGQILLPMYLPVLVLGFCVGPLAGAVAGILSPVISFISTGMPAKAMLPFMMLELCCFGLFAGLLKNSRQHPAIKTLVVQLASRVLRILATIVALYAFSDQQISLKATLDSMLLGIPGMLLQIAWVPYLMKKIGRSV